MRTVWALAACLLASASLSAAEQGQAPASRAAGRRIAAAAGLEMLQGVNLTTEQKAKVEEIRKDLGGKIRDALQKLDGVLTEEQKKARAEAVKAARGSGRGLQGSREAIEKSLKLTDEQKAKMAEIRKELEPLRTQLREKITALLTAEQKEQIKKNLQERVGRKPQ